MPPHRIDLKAFFLGWQYDFTFKKKNLLKGKIGAYANGALKIKNVSRETVLNRQRKGEIRMSIFDIPFEWAILIGVNFFIILILLLMNLSNRSKIKKLKSKYNKFMNGMSGVSLEAVLENCIDKVNGVIDKNKELEYSINEIRRNMYYCVQKVGVVRYNAFDDVGSDLSFSVALLDHNDDGVVISSLYARESSSTYAKPIARGKSKYALSAEEIKAIDNARKGHITNVIDE